MHVDTVDAAVDLRDTKVNEVDQCLRQPALHDVAVHAAERPHTGRCRSIVIHTLSHLTSPEKHRGFDRTIAPICWVTWSRRLSEAGHSPSATDVHECVNTCDGL
jgi:hypothetical protein